MDLILGTAGHIDHGKTALVKALTGVDTDRLPEEKKRGITIELGYARLDLGDVRLGIVDVPGHERFVHNMLAGATGIDLALLVVAADDSVMPQTREHLEILRLLDLSAGVIALTKCDLAAPDWIDLVESEIRELVDGTFLANAPIIRTSAASGEGVDAIRNALEQAVTNVTPRSALRDAAGEMSEVEPRHAESSETEHGTAPFRMAIDRTFTIAGHGTVVTGSVVSGSARVGESLAIEPGRLTARIRGLQNHDEAAEVIHRGQRAAVNLAGVHHNEIERGQELATPGYLQPSRLLTVQMRLLSSAPRPLKFRSRVRVHLGTTDIMATAAILPFPSSPSSGRRSAVAEEALGEPVFLSSDRLLAPGESALAQLHLAEDVVATWRQPFVIRWPSPVETIGGGIVLQPNARRLRPRDIKSIEMAYQLSSDDPKVRVAAATYFAGWETLSPVDCFRATGIADVAPSIRSLLNEGTLLELTEPRGGSLVIHQGVLETMARRVSDVLGSLHHAEPLRRGFDVGDVGRIVAQTKPFEQFWPAIVNRLEAMGILELATDRSRVSLVGAGPKLSRGERALLDDLVEQIHMAGVKPPSVHELKAGAAKNKASVTKLLELAAADGTLARVNQEFWLHVETLRDVKATLREALADGRGMTLSEIRERLGTTRKYAVPICERLDADRFTVRQGDQRFLAE